MTDLTPWQKPSSSPTGSGSLTVVDAGTDLTTARPDAPVVYWQFAAGVDVGTDGANVVNRQPGDLIFVASA